MSPPLMEPTIMEAKLLDSRPLDKGACIPPGDDKAGADKPDRFGEELADDARIWRVYGQVAKDVDKEKVQRWNGGLNNLALFAALFSGITTTFIVQSQNDLKPDFTELSYRILNATASGKRYVEEPFSVPGSARLVNSLWVASLISSLSAALIAIMGQDWIEMYVDRPVCNPRQWAEIRTFRMKGVERWYMPGVIASAPVLLHISLFLFGIGLIIFLAMDTLTQRVCLGLCCVMAFLYAVTTVSPVLWSSSPFRSPATELMRRWLCAFLRPKAAEQKCRNTVTEDVAVVQTNELADQSTSHSRIFLLLRRAVSAASSAVRRAKILVLSGLSSTNVDLASDPSVEGQGGLRQPSWARTRHHPFTRLVFPEKLISASSRSYSLLQRYLSSSLENCMRVLVVYGPDLSQGWTDIPQNASSAPIAESLAWLYSATSAPDVMRAVVTALGDLVIGEEVMNEEISKQIFELIRADAESNLDRPSILELSRYVLVARNLHAAVQPAPILRRFDNAVRSQGLLPEDVFLAMAYLTDDFMLESIEDRLLVFDSTTLQRICGSISACTPITLTTIISSLHCRREGNLTYPSFASRALSTGLIIMNRWRDALPSKLDKVADALGALLPDGSLHAGPCKPHGNGPSATYRIIHILILVALSSDYPTSPTVDLLLHVLRMEDSGEHPCVIKVFGIDGSATILSAAWENRRARDIRSLLLHTGVLLPIPYHLRSRNHHSSPRLFARMLIRCLVPPYPLLDSGPTSGNSGKESNASCREMLALLVADMGRNTPWDVAQALLQRSILAEIAQERCDQAFWSIMTGMVQMLCGLKENAVADKTDKFAQLWAMFVSSPAGTYANGSSSGWRLASAIGTALTSLDARYIRLLGGSYDYAHWSETRTQDFASVLGFLAALRHLRSLKPENELWEEISRSAGIESSNWKTIESDAWCGKVHEATGVDPEQFAERERPARNETWPFEFFANLPEEVYESGAVAETHNLP